MKPIKATIHDTDALIELGRASVQVVHDLKNQINGLKLYATFLRKRMEKSERPADELETINKIMAGLERSAADMNMLVRFGRPLELQRSSRLDLVGLLSNATEGEFVQAQEAAASENGDAFRGDFDPAALTEALKNIHAGARSHAVPGEAAPRVSLLREEVGATAMPVAIVEWQGVKANGETDVFNSFNGGAGLRLALAARIIQAHDGIVEQEPGRWRVRLPLRSDE